MKPPRPPDVRIPGVNCALLMDWEVCVLMPGMLVPDWAIEAAAAAAAAVPTPMLVEGAEGAGTAVGGSRMSPASLLIFTFFLGFSSLRSARLFLISLLSASSTPPTPRIPATVSAAAVAAETGGGAVGAGGPWAPVNAFVTDERMLGPAKYGAWYRDWWLCPCCCCD